MLGLILDRDSFNKITGRILCIGTTCLEKIKFQQKIRDAETKITWLRMNCCRLSSYCVFTVDRHSTGAVAYDTLTKLSDLYCLTMYNTITISFDNYKSFNIAYIDFKAGFDCILHSYSCMLMKLSSYSGISNNLYRWIAAFLSNRFY